MAGPTVAVRGMRVGYGSFVVLEDVDLTVANGEIVAVTGVNGAGKSTLLSCLAGLHRPTAGTVTVLGGPPRDDAAFWRAVALVADQPAWYPGLSLREHLELVRMTHEPVRGWCLPTGELIELFGLPGRADAVPTDLSSGQRQRLSLAAALARPSRLLLTRAVGLLLGLIAAWPTLRAVYAGQVHASTFGAQVVFAAVVLGGYLMIAVRSV